QFLSGNPLLELDLRLVHRQVEQCMKRKSSQQPLRIVDLGCGTGRVAHRLSGFDVHVLNIDLSESMLKECKKLHLNPTKFAEVRGNMAELDFLKPDSIDLACCLFSSIGMLRPREQRIACLNQTFNALKPSGRFLLHVHNRFQSLWDPGGIWWLVSGYVAGKFGRSEWGDRIYPYRGLPRMFLHIYSRRELLADLRAAGFQHIDLLPIHSSGEELISANSWFQSFRAGGFFAIAQKQP
ncbi:MAG: class I SAM-dependent methyltransferase, partial [Planctomycetota bacterium]